MRSHRDEAADNGLAALTCLSARRRRGRQRSRASCDCKNDDARVELYLPAAIVDGRRHANVRLARPVNGYYALDLSDAGKGKPLEPCASA